MNNDNPHSVKSLLGACVAGFVMFGGPVLIFVLLKGCGG